MKLSSDAAVFKKHNFVEITDSDIDNAYPLALLTHVIIREFYYVDGDVSQCSRVKNMVKVKSGSY